MKGIDIYTKSEFDSKLWTGTYSDYSAMTAHDEFTVYAALDGIRPRVFLGDIEFILCSCSSSGSGTDNPVTPTVTMSDLKIEFGDYSDKVLEDVLVFGGGGAANIGHWNAAHTKYDWENHGEYLECGFDLSNATQKGYIHVYAGGEMPPAIFINTSGGGAIYQNGVQIAATGLFLILGENRLLHVPNAQLCGYGKIHYDPTEKEAEEKGWVAGDMFHWLTSTYTSATSDDEPGYRINGRYCYAVSNIATAAGHSGSSFDVYENGVVVGDGSFFGTGEAMFAAVSGASSIVIDLDDFIN